MFAYLFAHGDDRQTSRILHDPFPLEVPDTAIDLKENVPGCIKHIVVCIRKRLYFPLDKELHRVRDTESIPDNLDDLIITCHSEIKFRLLIDADILLKTRSQVLGLLLYQADKKEDSNRDPLGGWQPFLHFLEMKLFEYGKRGSNVKTDFYFILILAKGVKLENLSFK